MSLMRSTSSGQTSTQTVQPLSAMHLASSTTTGTEVWVLARGIGVAPVEERGLASGGGADALLVVEVLLVLGDRHDVGLDGALLADHPAVLLAEQRVAEPVGVVLVRIIRAHVVEAPAALGAVQRGMRRHVGAIDDRLHFQRAQQFVGILRDHLAFHVLADLTEPAL